LVRGSFCTSGGGFANSPQSCSVEFINNGNVLITGDLLADCESSRKEYIVVQNVPLALTCTHLPIFPPFELLSTCLSVLMLLLCVCRGTRAGQMAGHVLQTKASHSAPHKLSDTRALGSGQAALKILMKLKSSLEFSHKAGLQR